MSFMLRGIFSDNFDKIILWSLEKTICSQIIYPLAYYIPTTIPTIMLGLKPYTNLIKSQHSKRGMSNPSYRCFKKNFFLMCNR